MRYLYWYSSWSRARVWMIDTHEPNVFWSKPWNRDCWTPATGRQKATVWAAMWLGGVRLYREPVLSNDVLKPSLAYSWAKNTQKVLK